MMKIGVLWCTLVILLLLGDILSSVEASPPPYLYRRYPYKKKQKNEKKINHLKAGCEMNCGSNFSLKDIECTRRCMSEHCFQNIYGSDPLEEGEIDVRYMSFKGCVLQNM